MTPGIIIKNHLIESDELSVGTVGFLTGRGVGAEMIGFLFGISIDNSSGKTSKINQNNTSKDSLASVPFH